MANISSSRDSNGYDSSDSGSSISVPGRQESITSSPSAIDVPLPPPTLIPIPPPPPLPLPLPLPYSGNQFFNYKYPLICIKTNLIPYISVTVCYQATSGATKG